MNTLQDKLAISDARVHELNALLTNPQTPVIDELLRLVERLGGPEAINARAREARQLPNLLARLRAQNSPYLKDLDWLINQRDSGAFVSKSDYTARVQGATPKPIDETNAVTLEISALQFFPGCSTRRARPSRSASCCPAASSASATWPSRWRTTATPWRSLRPCRSWARAMSKRWTPKARTAATSIWAARPPSPATSAASARRITTRSNGRKSS